MSAAPAADLLFAEHSLEAYRDWLARGGRRLSARVADVSGPDGGPFTGVAPAALATELAAVDLDRPLRDLDAALDELGEVYLRDAVWFHHPRYLAHLNCPVLLPGLLAEQLAAAVNSSLDTWDQSAGATLIERRVVAWTADRIGFGAEADGVFTSGGTQSNLHALLLARQEALSRLAGGRSGGPAPDPVPAPDPEPDPLRQARLRILTSEAAHFSVVTSARLLGLSADAVLAVPTDDRWRMRPGALAEQLERCRAEGLTVAAVVATAGTTDFGSLDPLPAIAELCRRAGVWLHVDAAYGCGLLASPTRRHLLAGIERADSVTVDFHKSWFQPVSCSAMIVKSRRSLRHSNHHADYLNPERMARAGIPNLVDHSLQTTRRFDALKVWLTLRTVGVGAVGELFDRVVDLAAQAAALIDADPRFELTAVPTLSTVVFRYRPAPGPDGEPAPEAVDAANLRARRRLSDLGLAVIASTTVRGRHHLKFTLLNPRTTVADLAGVLDLIAVHAGDLARPRPPEQLCPVAG